ncbi:MAG: hypothetical protein JW959_13640 [Pirellulales bacterium]|nr:hypothetical protein [Pirellulales bacterium]
MVRHEFDSWQRPVPLPPLPPVKTPTGADASSAEADRAAAPPSAEQLPPPPRDSRDDDYQWLILL